ncbi:MAG: glycoside hydrolase family 16 protein [Luteolibacter sp.]
MQRFIVSLLISSLMVSRAEDSVKPERDPGYKLVWADEFNRDGPPDPAVWRSEEGFTRNKELQWYRAANSICQGGFLVIEARKEQVTNPNYEKASSDWTKSRRMAEYTSGSLISIGQNEWKFGRYEVRARFKALPGLWPAIWTTGRGHWPHGGEIDIMEFYKDQILANFVWAGKGGKDHWASSTHPIGDFGKDSWNEAFHVWVMEWTEEKIDIYLDGKLLNSLDMKTTANEDGPSINPFLGPQHFRFDMAIGSNGGEPDETRFPQRYEVDYVRIYQK